MAKIPFNIKYRPQIESGEYKVVIYMRNSPTEECPVEILKWNSNSDTGCIIGCFRVNGKDKVYIFDENGEHKVSGIQGNRLFIVTPEKELSEFEKVLGDIVKEAVEKEVGDNAAIWAIGRGHTEKLLALAREELMEELELDGRRSDAFYSGFKNGKKRGKAEALKDLPRWRHAFTTCSVEEMPKNSEYSYYSPDNKALIVLLENSNEAKCLMLDDLKKLPGFKEDESHE